MLVDDGAPAASPWAQVRAVDACRISFTSVGRAKRGSFASTLRSFRIWLRSERGGTRLLGYLCRTPLCTPVLPSRPMAMSLSGHEQRLTLTAPLHVF
ncbi:MAG: hypothetical protein JW889_15905 [Verrucomicrobia bacterium]|nr:hypothetical protein [Verrucomicrobiota bacterium]